MKKKSITLEQFYKAAEAIVLASKLKHKHIAVRFSLGSGKDKDIQVNVDLPEDETENYIFACGKTTASCLIDLEYRIKKYQAEKEEETLKTEV